MNTRQKVILWCGAIVVCGMIAYPPWVNILETSDRTYIKDIGYHFFAAPPRSKGYNQYVQSTHAMNMQRLGLQIAIVAVITATAVATNGGTTGSKPSPPHK